MNRSNRSAETFPARLQAVEALADLASGKSPRHDLAETALAIDDVCVDLTSAAAASTYAAFAGALRIVDALAHWREAVLNAHPDADRFLRSAKERYRLWTGEYEPAPATDALRAALHGIDVVTAIEQAPAFAGALARVPLPIGLFAQLPKPDWAREMPHAPAEPEPKVELTVAFLKFQFDGKPAAQVHQLAAQQVHDLDIEVRVSRWPEDKHELRLAPISVEPRSTYEFPTFQFPKPDGPPPFTLKQSARAILLMPQGMHSRPFEFKYTAEFIPERGDQPVAVVGHRTLIVDGADTSKYQVCGYPGLDNLLYGLRTTLRHRPNVPQAETEDALQVLITLCNLAGRAVQDAEFKGDWDEKAFQKHVRAELRRNPLIGAALDEHANAGGGITDLSLRGLPIELKVVRNTVTSVEACDDFLGQAASYAVAKSKRTAIVCVLDSSVKASEPVLPESLFGMRLAAEGAVTVLVLVIQGNLARPSDLSR